MYILYIYILSISGSKRFNFHFIITNTYVIFGFNLIMIRTNTYVIFWFNLIMIRPNIVYFMYILSISGSKRFNFHFYYY